MLGKDLHPFERKVAVLVEHRLAVFDLDVDEVPFGVPYWSAIRRHEELSEASAVDNRVQLSVMHNA